MFNIIAYIDIPWFAIEWDGEDGVTAVPQALIVGNNKEPSLGDHIEVVEKSTKKIYGGKVWILHTYGYNNMLMVHN